jgi:hypothetical protein
VNKELINLLNNRLIERLLDDLRDDTKSTPGLYQVVRGVVNDNREVLDGLPSGTLDTLESAMKAKMPFKFKSSQI